MHAQLKNQESNSLVPLSDELDHINNVIELARLKSANKTFITIQCESFEKNTNVIPLLLLTLVENIFKHGDVSDPSHPAFISITNEAGERIRFISSNKPRKLKEMPGSNLGLGNARTRLYREYGDEAKMEVSKSEDLFQVEIVFPMRRFHEKQSRENSISVPVSY